MYSAAAIGTGYALALIPNVELVTVILFLSGCHLGARTGAMVGAGTEFIFSAANPLGSGLLFPPLIAAQVVAMGFVGAAGGWTRKLLLSESFPPITRAAILAVIGFALTFLYDVLTTVAYPLATGLDRRATAGVLLSGILFTLLHQITNAVLFASVVPKMIRFLRK